MVNFERPREVSETSIACEVHLAPKERSNEFIFIVPELLCDVVAMGDRQLICQYHRQDIVGILRKGSRLGSYKERRGKRRGTTGYSIIHQLLLSGMLLAPDLDGKYTFDTRL